MIDTHCHLNFPQLAEDAADVLARAAEAGVESLVIPGTDVATSRSALSMAAQYPSVSAAVGIHPTDAPDYNDEARAAFTELLESHPEIVALGEVGLDYFREDRPEEHRRQQALFTEMIGLATQYDLPLIIHSRDCFADIHAMLREQAAGRKVVIHCFSGSQQEAAAWLDAGFLLSFTGMITYKKNEALREVVRFVPLDRMMVETDAPYLAPEGFRGQTCEPRFVRNVAECVAQVKGIDLDQVDQVTTATARTFFSL